MEDILYMTLRRLMLNKPPLFSSSLFIMKFFLFISRNWPIIIKIEIKTRAKSSPAKTFACDFYLFGENSFAFLTTIKENKKKFIFLI